MRFAVCNEMFEGWALDDVFRFVAEAGYAAVELAPYTLATDVREVTAERRREVRASARRHGLEIAGLHWLLVGPEGMHVNHPDPVVRARTITYLEELIQACAELGGRVLVFGSPKQRRVLPGVDYAEATRLALDAFAACARAAERHGVTFCLEALPGPEADFMTTSDEVIAMVEAIDSSALRMVLDVKSMASEPTPIPELIRRAAPHAAHIHANDVTRLGPGSGEIDYVPIFAALREVGYDGYVSVEVFDYSPGPERIARESFAYMEQALAEARRSSRHATGSPRRRARRDRGTPRRPG